MVRQPYTPDPLADLSSSFLVWTQLPYRRSTALARIRLRPRTAIEGARIPASRSSSGIPGPRLDNRQPEAFFGADRHPFHGRPARAHRVVDQVGAARVHSEFQYRDLARRQIALDPLAAPARTAAGVSIRFCFCSVLLFSYFCLCWCRSGRVLLLWVVGLGLCGLLFSFSSVVQQPSSRDSVTRGRPCGYRDRSRAPSCSAPLVDRAPCGALAACTWACP